MKLIFDIRELTINGGVCLELPDVISNIHHHLESFYAIPTSGEFSGLPTRHQIPSSKLSWYLKPILDVIYLNINILNAVHLSIASRELLTLAVTIETTNVYSSF